MSKFITTTRQIWSSFTFSFSFLRLGDGAKPKATLLTLATTGHRVQGRPRTIPWAFPASSSPSVRTMASADNQSGKVTEDIGTLKVENTKASQKLEEAGIASPGKEEKASPTKGNKKEETTQAKEGQASPTKGKEKDDEPQSSPYVTRGSKVLRETRREEVEKVKDKFLKLKLAEKRKLYKCGEKYTTLDKVTTWPEHFEEKLAQDKAMAKWWTKNKSKVEVEISSELNDKMSLFCGDITTLEIDAIANAANESLLGGGGVDGAIHSAAGPHLRGECELLNGCSAGDAKITCAYKLPAKYVVHTVGPRGEKPEVLKECYSRSLNLLKENNLRSIAFPCISTGIFGYPNVNAAKVALSTIRNWLEKEDYAKNIDRVIMCLFLKKDIDIYDEQMQMFFPIDRTEDGDAK